MTGDQSKFPYEKTASSLSRGTVIGARCSEWQLRAAVSIGRPSTLVFLERWSVKHEVSSPSIFTGKEKSEIWDRWQPGRLDLADPLTKIN
jgi:hypothetical protein